MKTDTEIRQRLASLLADERLEYPPASTFENAPLALIQVSLKAQVQALRWVLGEFEEKE